MTILDALKNAVLRLKAYNISEPIIKTRIILANILNMRKEELIVNENKELDEHVTQVFFKQVDMLCNNVPLQYITKKQEFMGDIFEVDENVLIPRCDTEILVEEAIKCLKNIHNRENKSKCENDKNSKTNVKCLELCTGSGAVAISIAKRCNINMVATDISKNALCVAKKNAQNLKVNIDFIESDLFENITGRYDLIVANPPYIETNTIKTLAEEVKQEPIIALDGGEDGLDFYRKIANEAWKFLKNGRFLCLEIGYNQKDAVTKLLEEKYSNILCIKDLSGNDRVIICSYLV